MQRSIALAIMTACLGISMRGQQSHIYYFPQVVDGTSGSGTRRTTIVLSNVDAASATVQISFTHEDGSPRAVDFPALGSGSNFSMTLAPGGSQILQTDGTGDGSAGAATVTSTMALGASTIVSSYDMNGNPLSESGASSADLHSGYVIPIDTTGGLNTGAGIYNPAAAPANLTFALFDTTGTAMETATATVAAGGHMTRMAAGDLFPDITSFQGTLVLTASVPVAAVAVRQNPGANVYTLLDAVSQISMGLSFYLPQLADGPSSAGSLQTTFILQNLTANPATATISLVQDSGTAWMVNIPNVDNNSNFTVSLPPGGSAFLRTDGQSPYTTGAATISSTQPIGVAAVITAKDGNGSVLTETGINPSRAQRSFLVAFDATNNIKTGLALFNPGLDPVTLTVNQLDPTGNVLASAQSQPLAPGAHMAMYATDLFPGATGVQGSLSVNATGSVGAAVVVAGLRQNGTPLSMATMPVAPLPLTGSGINLTSTLDNKSQAAAAIPPAGGTLSLTDSRGNKFTLTIPANALLSTTTVTMTAITGVNGLPAGGSFNTGVQLEPDGLALLQPALLTIKPVNPVDPDLRVPLGWYGTGQSAYLNLVQPQPGDVTFVLNHFSGAGLAVAPAITEPWVTALLLQIANLSDVDASEVDFFMNRAKADQDEGRDPSGHFADAVEVINMAFMDWVRDLMELALESGDLNLLQCAVTQATAYQRQRELLGLSASDAIGSVIHTFLLSAQESARTTLLKGCEDNHDPMAGMQLIASARQLALMGVDTGDLSTVIEQCPPNPMLKFQSEMSATENVNITGSLGGISLTESGSVNLDYTVAAGMVLMATVTPMSTTTSGDGYISYMVAGSGPLTYTSATGTVNATISAGGTNIICTGTLVSKTGSTFTVQSPGSEIKYQFKPAYNPKAVLKNGLHLCDFCPVAFFTQPVSVSLTVDPGMPGETYQTQCTPDVQVPSVPTPAWLGFWNYFHGPEGNVIMNWQIPGSNSFAHKDISRSAAPPVPALPPPFTITGTINVTEKTMFDLNPPQTGASLLKRIAK